MTADNLTFSIEIDFIPDIQDGRAELKKSMKSVSEKFDGTYILDPKARPIISGLSKDDVEGALKELGLLAFGTWPACILTATIVSPLRSVRSACRTAGTSTPERRPSSPLHSSLPMPSLSW